MCFGSSTPAAAVQPAPAPAAPSPTATQTDPTLNAQQADLNAYGTDNGGVPNLRRADTTTGTVTTPGAGTVVAGGAGTAM